MKPGDYINYKKLDRYKRKTKTHSAKLLGFAGDVVIVEGYDGGSRLRKFQIRKDQIENWHSEEMEG